jgi:hypothetical protein
VRIVLSCTKPRFRPDLEREPIVLAHARNECLATRRPECRRVLAHLHCEINQGCDDADATEEVAQVAKCFENGASCPNGWSLSCGRARSYH